MRSLTGEGLRGGSRREFVGVLVLGLLISVFYWWTMNSTHRPWKWGIQTDYYNLLVHGWLDGHLYMKADVPEALLKLADPYDPALRPAGLGLHDITFYQGKYYIYFGVTPAVVLMLPFRLLTGTDLPLADAVLVLVLGGFWASVAVWWQVRVRYFPMASAVATLAGVALLGLASLSTVLLRRPSVYELAISSGYCFAMLALWCGFRALHAERRPGLWLAAASLAAGLTVGSRPSYVLAAPALLAAFLAWFWFFKERGQSAEARPAHRGGMAAAAVLPLAGCGVLLALHNYLRFGNPFEFGVRYMLSGFYEAKMTHFSPSYFGHNVWCYFLSRPELSAWFPFIDHRDWPPGPVGYQQGDGYYGVLATLPILALGPVALAALWWRRRPTEERLRLWLSGVALLGVGAAALLCGFYSSAGRYQVDFAPALIFISAVGLLVVSTGIHEGVAWRWAWFIRGLIGVALAWSLAFALMLSFQANNEFRGNNPPGFRAIAQWFNVVPGWFSGLRGERFGPAELSVRLPEGRTGHREPLVTSGIAGHADFLFVEYLDGGRVRFGFDSWGSSTLWSEPVALAAGKDHHLKVVYGALTGPPILGRFQPPSPEYLEVAVDGQLVWTRDASFHPARSTQVYFGSNPIGGTACEEKFTGTLVSVKRGG